MRVRIIQGDDCPTITGTLVRVWPNERIKVRLADGTVLDGFRKPGTRIEIIPV